MAIKNIVALLALSAAVATSAQDDGKTAIVSPDGVPTRPPTQIDPVSETESKDRLNEAIQCNTLGAPLVAPPVCAEGQIPKRQGCGMSCYIDRPVCTEDVRAQCPEVEPCADIAAYKAAHEARDGCCLSCSRPLPVDDEKPDPTGKCADTTRAQCLANMPKCDAAAGEVPVFNRDSCCPSCMPDVNKCDRFAILRTVAAVPECAVGEEPMPVESECGQLSCRRPKPTACGACGLSRCLNVAVRAWREAPVQPGDDIQVDANDTVTQTVRPRDDAVPSPENLFIDPFYGQTNGNAYDAEGRIRRLTEEQLKHQLNVQLLINERLRVTQELATTRAKQLAVIREQIKANSERLEEAVTKAVDDAKADIDVRIERMKEAMVQASIDEATYQKAVDAVTVHKDQVTAALDGLDNGAAVSAVAQSVLAKISQVETADIVTEVLAQLNTDDATVKTMVETQVVELKAQLLQVQQQLRSFDATTTALGDKLEQVRAETQRQADQVADAIKTAQEQYEREIYKREPVPEPTPEPPKEEPTPEPPKEEPTPEPPKVAPTPEPTPKPPKEEPTPEPPKEEPTPEPPKEEPTPEPTPEPPKEEPTPEPPKEEPTPTPEPTREQDGTTLVETKPVKLEPTSDTSRPLPEDPNALPTEPTQEPDGTTLVKSEPTKEKPTRLSGARRLLEIQPSPTVEPTARTSEAVSRIIGWRPKCVPFGPSIINMIVQPLTDAAKAYLQEAGVDSCGAVKAVVEDKVKSWCTSSPTRAAKCAEVAFLLSSFSLQCEMIDGSPDFKIAVRLPLYVEPEEQKPEDWYKSVNLPLPPQYEAKPEADDTEIRAPPAITGLNEETTPQTQPTRDVDVSRQPDTDGARRRRLLAEENLQSIVEDSFKQSESDFAFATDASAGGEVEGVEETVDGDSSPASSVVPSLCAVVAVVAALMF